MSVSAAVPPSSPLLCPSRFSLLPESCSGRVPTSCPQLSSSPPLAPVLKRRYLSGIPRIPTQGELTQQHLGRQEGGELFGGISYMWSWFRCQLGQLFILSHKLKVNIGQNTDIGFKNKEQLWAGGGGYHA